MRFGAVQAVTEVTAQVRSGEVLGIIGPNGAGKTTLIDALTGYAPYSGRIALNERDLKGLSPFRRSRLSISRCFQSLELLEDLTVEENLDVAAFRPKMRDWITCLFWSRSSVGTRSEVLWALEQMGLSEVRDALPEELSLGQRKLVAVARSVVAKPRLLLLDEPAAGLSEQERNELVVLIRRLVADQNMAAIIIEHDVEVVMNVADRVLVLDQGSEIAHGSPAAVRKDDAVISAYLGQKRSDADKPDVTQPGLAR